MDALKAALLALHVAAGFISVAAALTAASVKALRLPHRAHLIAGRAFAWGMLGICATAIPLSILGGQVLLFLVALLSGYLALAGWREAVRPRSARPWIDRAAPIAMIMAAVAMVAWGALALGGGRPGGIVPLAFGTVGLVLAIADLRRVRKPAEGAERIAQHMIRMMAATISVVTALLVVNARFDPGWLLWLAPTVVLTPVIAVWAHAIRHGAFR